MSKKINKKKILKICTIAIILILVFIIGLKINDFIILGKNKKTNLVINNKNVTANLKNEIIIEDDNIYLSKADLSNFFDKYIYEDEKNHQIITTYENKIATISLENKTICNRCIK